MSMGGGNVHALCNGTLFFLSHIKKKGRTQCSHESEEQGGIISVCLSMDVVIQEYYFFTGPSVEGDAFICFKGEAFFIILMVTGVTFIAIYLSPFLI